MQEKAYEMRITYNCNQKANFFKAKIYSGWKSLRENTCTAVLSLEKWVSKQCRFIGQLNNEDSKGQSITVEENGQMVRKRCAANHVADTYTSESNVPVSISQKKKQEEN